MNPNPKLNRLAAAAKLAAAMSAGAFLLSACFDDDDAPEPNTLPANITQQGMTAYPAAAPAAGNTAATQDLLTAGLGRTGLGLATAPAYADPLNPTALELRRNAIYGN